MGNKVLVVDDEENVTELLKLYLEAEGFEVGTAGDGSKAVELVRCFKPDIIILDIMMPYKDGWQVARELRSESQIPIIMLSAKNQESDKILGLNLGGDDYITKPFSPGEVVARIRAVLRRTGSKSQGKEIIEVECLTIDFSKYEIFLGGVKVPCTPKEVELLWILAKNPGRVYTREQLLDKVWGYDYPGDSRTVDTHIKRLRRKIEDGHPFSYLQTVWGVGYKFEVIRNEEEFVSETS
ncbi:MAG TPA: response regulator transcription factor [Pseudobacteroides sp.]|uniref:response regulator transcription factor n=1 Tax=Pseudobacteroides sp. TaxID=1968840 RepID=UPI002F940700